jgi:hypothetical protein
MKTFYNDIENNNINNGDIIILSLANPGRVHFDFQNQLHRLRLLVPNLGVDAFVSTPIAN